MEDRPQSKTVESFFYRKFKLINLEDKKITLSYIIPENCLNGYNTVHGGFTYTLIEKAFIESLSHINVNIDNYVLVKLSVNYLEALKQDNEITIISYINKISKNLIIGEVQIFSKGILTNTGSIIFKSMRPKL